MKLFFNLNCVIFIYKYVCIFRKKVKMNFNFEYYTGYEQDDESSIEDETSYESEG